MIIYQTNAKQFGPGDVAFDLARMVFNPDSLSAIKPAIAIQEFKTIAESLHRKIVEELISLVKKGGEEPLRKS